VTGKRENTRLPHYDDGWNVLATSTHAGACQAMARAATEFEVLEFLDVVR
jgi:hypothetical protein